MVILVSSGSYKGWSFKAGECLIQACLVQVSLYTLMSVCVCVSEGGIIIRELGGEKSGRWAEG